VTIETAALAHVSAIEPYAPGKPISHVARELGLDPARIVKLASNENALGMSPAARRALERSATDAHRYPDMDCIELREGLAQYLDLPMDRLLVGAGSSELILLAARAFLERGRRIVVSQHAFVSYEGAARAVGARAVSVPTRGWQPDLDGMIAAIDPSVRIVFIASPNNPTGVLVEPAALEKFIAAVPDNVLVVLDEAYHDFVEPRLRVDVRSLTVRHPNLLVLRTFSKVYGLAGLRVGYAVSSPKVISLLRRLQPPFSVSATAQAAALAALGDADFRERSVDMIRTERPRVCQELQSLGVEYVPSFGNFVLVRVGNGKDVFRALLPRGVIVRPVDSYGLAPWIRVTVGLPEENATFIRELRQLLADGRQLAGSGSRKLPAANFTSD